MRLRLSLLASISLLLATPLLGQDPQGVRLQLEYRAEYQPGLVVLPFSGEGAAAGVAETVRGIVRQDLDFSNRFEMVDPGRGVRAGERVDRALWRERGADWVVEGNLVPRGSGYRLSLTLHDAVYGQERGRESFEIAPQRDGDFRMSVHRAADQVVMWVTGEPGMAASRIAFVREARGNKEIYIVDSDGENLQRVTTDNSIALSPAWSPDARRIAYTTYRDGVSAIYERELRSGRDVLITDQDGVNITPAYSPDGRTLAFAAWMDGNTEIAFYDRERACCLRQRTQGRQSDSLSPTFSPDGRRMAFVSNRLGEPHIYVMNVSGGEARAVSDFVYGRGGYHTAPEWSPRGDHLVYAARANGSMQLVFADLANGRSRLLTDRGRNEDPSWAPDGRHVVFASDRERGGLFILDTVSGRVRPLVRGWGHGLPAWSPRM